MWNPASSPTAQYAVRRWQGSIFRMRPAPKTGFPLARQPENIFHIIPLRIHWPRVLHSAANLALTFCIFAKLSLRHVASVRDDFCKPIRCASRSIGGAIRCKTSTHFPERRNWSPERPVAFDDVFNPATGEVQYQVPDGQCSGNHRRDRGRRRRPARMGRNQPAETGARHDGHGRPDEPRHGQTGRSAERASTAKPSPTPRVICSVVWK